MKYLKKFANEADYNTFFDSDDYAEPNISRIVDGNMIKYNVPFLGVGIQHINGKLYTIGQWRNKGFANDMANGVAVKTETKSFVIAKERVANSTKWSSSAYTAVDGVLLTTDAELAVTDFAGESNTFKASQDATSGAVYLCANYTFPNGAKGYLPALGELMLATKFSNEIVEAMTLIGASSIKFDTGNLWSSTQNSQSRAWYLNWSSKSVLNTDKANYVNMGVLPFTTL